MRTTKKEVLAAQSVIANIPKQSAIVASIYNRILKQIKPLFKDFWIFAVIAVVVAGAQIALSDKASTGVYVNALAFIVLVCLAIWISRARMLAISATILPVTSMIILVLPKTSYFAQTVVYYSSILVLALIYRFIFVLDSPLKKTKLGKIGYLTLLGLIIIIGQLLGVIGYLMLRHHYLFSHVSLPLVAACVVVFAIAEETFFRGLIQQRASQFFHPALAACLSLIMFVCSTIGHVTYLMPLFALIAGTALVTSYYKKQNLILTITINASMKLAYVGLIAGFVLR